ncbi:TIGR00730 family Rossman fold protein [Hydrocarboniphaga sp.]|uniref:LOG family protein n=1 Tax=Hydrocarboniphaga sp. TaxID=2033016 RepID=UPI003D102118
MATLRRLCVFCGSSIGRDPAFAEAARALGRAIADEGVALVYGGASVGLMGAVADAALAAGGEVIGVLPRSLFARELAHRGLSELRVVGSMHERKALMAELSDGFIAMPGGIGTFEELFEIWTWAQLGDHAKPCSLLNVNGFYDGLIAFLDQVVDQQLLKPRIRDMLLVERDPAALLARLAAYQAPVIDKWIAPDQR